MADLNNNLSGKNERIRSLRLQNTSGGIYGGRNPSFGGGSSNTQANARQQQIEENRMIELEKQRREEAKKATEKVAKAGIRAATGDVTALKDIKKKDLQAIRGGIYQSSRQTEKALHDQKKSKARRKAEKVAKAALKKTAKLLLRIIIILLPVILLIIFVLIVFIIFRQWTCEGQGFLAGVSKFFFGESFGCGN
ncbi:MAG: hypothetical protein WC242_03015 [Candidatus Paceibacterota bacterium]|jgi:cation transport ATPase